MGRLRLFSHILGDFDRVTDALSIAYDKNVSGVYFAINDTKTLYRSFCKCGFVEGNPVSVCPKCGGALVDILSTECIYRGVSSPVTRFLSALSHKKEPSGIEALIVTMYEFSFHFGNDSCVGASVSSRETYQMTKHLDGTYSLSVVSPNSPWSLIEADSALSVFADFCPEFVDIMCEDTVCPVANRITHLFDCFITLPKVFTKEFTSTTKNWSSICANIEARDIHPFQVTASAHNISEYNKDMDLWDVLETFGVPRKMENIVPIFVEQSYWPADYEIAEAFANTVVGTILIHRTQNRQYSARELVFNMDAWNKLFRRDDYDDACFTQLFREMIDQLNDIRNIGGEYLKRCEDLLREGVIPSEETIRTKTYNSIMNRNKYSLREEMVGVDFNELMQTNPLAAVAALAQWPST